MEPAPEALAERFVRLGLGLGEHIDGLVDAYYGPEALRPAGADDPAELGAEAVALLGELDAVEDEQRRRWFSGQLRALECVSELARGIPVPWREAVRRCYDLDVSPAPDESFADAHARLEDALPGSGDLAARLEAWLEAQVVEPSKILSAVHALADELREATRALVDLPDGEGVDIELVANEPWAAFNWYCGDLRSRIEMNTDLPVRAHTLPSLAAHEIYPGHHTERACKEALLVRGRGWIESTILLIHTPECVVAEGIATNAVTQAFGDAWLERSAEILEPLGIAIDVDGARAVSQALDGLAEVGVNIAYYAAEEGWSEDDCVAYHRRWALSPEDRARKAVSFATHPLWSPYVPTYSYGKRLVESFADAAPDGFRRVLTEQLTPGDLRQAQSLGSSA